MSTCVCYNGSGKGKERSLNIIDLAETLGRRLTTERRTIAVAESCTGGDLSHALSALPGASAFFLGGIIAYHNEVKVNLLDVPSATIAQHGAVSEQTAIAMASGCRTRFDSDIAVAITGIAGPSGGTREKPVGLVFLAAATRDHVRGRRLMLSGDRNAIRNDAAVAALSLVRSLLDEESAADRRSSLNDQDPTG